jgi:hypothetical protein
MPNFLAYTAVIGTASDAGDLLSHSRGWRWFRSRKQFLDGKPKTSRDNNCIACWPCHCHFPRSVHVHFHFAPYAEDVITRWNVFCKCSALELCILIKKEI